MVEEPNHLSFGVQVNLKRTVKMGPCLLRMPNADPTHLVPYVSSLTSLELLDTMRHKVLVTRNIGEDALAIIKKEPDLDVLPFR